ncbi:MAG: ABC transporter substrate-binding protein [Cellulosilyticaceae bacterium]
MKKFAKKFALITIAAAMATATFAGCSSPKATGSVIIGTMEMNGVFSPFFSQTGYDEDIVEMVHAPLIRPDRYAQPEEALATYNVEEIKNEDGTVKETIYTFTIKDKMEFSDGTAITADDAIFTYYVTCDPNYDGRSTLRTIPIVGMDEYVNGDAETITGIEKVDEKTFKVTLEGVDPSALWKIGGVHVAPKAYYGEGFEKGKLDGVKSKDATPMGAGPYKFEKFENNVVTLVANEKYFEGAPKIEKLKFQVMASANKFEALKTNEVDITDPSSSPEMVAQVRDAGFHSEIIDNLGYGYIGINANRIQDTNVRKGLMHLMNRKPAVDKYYGDLAQVIERPMSTVSWAYPQGVSEYYGFSPEKAAEYFTAAGYVNEGGKLMKDGQQLRIEVGIPGQGTMDHPTAPVLTQMKTELEKLGGVLEISDTDSTIFFDRLNNSDWDMWVAAWGSSVDPDLYQLYHSNGASNRYNVKNEELDQLIIDGRSTNDIEERKAIYATALDIIMEEAVEMPVYQRTNMYVYNQENINIDTLPENMTPYFSHLNAIHMVETLSK